MELEMSLTIGRNNVLLDVNNLTIYAKSKSGDYPIVKGIDLHLKSGEVLGIVGESGSGKSVTALSIMNLLNDNLYISNGEIVFNGINLREIPEKSWRGMLGKDISMIFQDYKNSFDPLYTIYEQVAEAIKIHNPNISEKEIREMVIEALLEVEIPDPENSMEKYPHQFSGGQLQRIVVAISMINDPKLIIADEATTSLDVTIQLKILKLLKRLCKKYNTALIVISHNMGLIKYMSDMVAVMYAGKLVELLKSEDLIEKSLHPYTRELMMALPENATKGEKIYTIHGDVRSLRESRYDCTFYPRCSHRQMICREKQDYLIIDESHKVLCVRAKDEK